MRHDLKLHLIGGLDGAEPTQEFIRCVEPSS
jgi:hypothetical protein